LEKSSKNHRGQQQKTIQKPKAKQIFLNSFTTALLPIWIRMLGKSELSEFGQKSQTGVSRHEDGQCFMHTKLKSSTYYQSHCD